MHNRSICLNAVWLFQWLQGGSFQGQPQYAIRFQQIRVGTIWTNVRPSVCLLHSWVVHYITYRKMRRHWKTFSFDWGHGSSRNPLWMQPSPLNFAGRSLSWKSPIVSLMSNYSVSTIRASARTDEERQYWIIIFQTKSTTNFSTKLFQTIKSDCSKYSGSKSLFKWRLELKLQHFYYLRPLYLVCLTLDYKSDLWYGIT